MIPACSILSGPCGNSSKLANTHRCSALILNLPNSSFAANIVPPVATISSTIKTFEPDLMSSL
ncbi:MAG: hypothetical protein MJ219_01110 [Mycoplasmoidaceae bacterium]|nr:hypothetical protein [Mycoplasmoidaceae bacterium]